MYHRTFSFPLLLLLSHARKSTLWEEGRMKTEEERKRERGREKSVTRTRFLRRENRIRWWKRIREWGREGEDAERKKRERLMICCFLIIFNSILMVFDSRFGFDWFSSLFIPHHFSLRLFTLSLSLSSLSMMREKVKQR